MVGKAIAIVGNLIFGTVAGITLTILASLLLTGAWLFAALAIGFIVINALPVILAFGIWKGVFRPQKFERNPAAKIERMALGVGTLIGIGLMMMRIG